MNQTTSTETKLPVYMKYAQTAEQNWLDSAAKLKPSDMSKPSLDVNPDDYPMIIEFNNVMDNTNQVHSTVDIDDPIFQPAPKIVVFEDYQPFSTVTKKLFFRNNDSVTRRMKIFKPDTLFFDVSAPLTLSGEPLKQSKIAAGMEICFIITFRPQEVREYVWDLVCSTEREKFIVPLRAIGLRPFLTIPDEVDFGPCPIKAVAEKKITIRNVGTSSARFALRSLSPQFTCPEQDVIIEAGATYPIIFTFTPQGEAQIEAEIEVTFSTGIKCYMAMKGFGRNVEVSLSTPSLTLESSYISLFSQKTLKIRNNSDAPISYRWKSFLTEDEEEAERNRLLVEINRIEEEERAMLAQKIADGYYDHRGHPNQPDGDADVDGSEDGEGRALVQPYAGSIDDELLLESSNYNLPFAARVDEATIVRKYRNLRKALELDKMLFVDDIFEISPIEGEVWAHAEAEVTVVFRPDTAALYNCLAFLDVSGRYDRLSLQLTGQGIGPHAALSFDVLDIGDIFVNEVNHYELSIKNKGDIPAQWTFMSSLTKFGNKFQFSPLDGYLLPNQAQSLSVRFESDVLGEFSEFFRFALQGNENMLVCQIKGHVLGPTFHFDCNRIDFGTVSFDYLHTLPLKLTNTSKVPMVYNLHVPQDGTYVKKEFNIEPCRGTLAPKETVDVVLEFIPTTVKVYDYSLAVDVLGVGDVLLSVPISAECIISQVRVELPARELDFGDVFIRYPYERELHITNLSSAVHTKFELMPQPKPTRSVVSYETEPTVAVIEPGDTMAVKVRLVGVKLGSYKVPLTIQVAGSVEPPMQAVLAFNTVGPKVAVDCTELKWGSIECLKDSPKVLRLTNVGLIDASMKIFSKMARSCYRIEMRELVLRAKQSHDLLIVANLDDSVVTKDEVHIVVDEGDNLMVPMVAKGIGTTMYCKQAIDVMDLGVQLTNIYFEKQIVLENKGRRPQQLKWRNRSVEAENADRLAKVKKLGKDPTQRLPKHLAPVDPSFTVTPEEITLRSRTATTFTFRGFSAVPRALSEVFVLESRVGKERQMKAIIESEVRCQVVNPLLQFSSSVLDFEYIWQKGVDAEIKRRPLILKNVSSLPLTFLLKTDAPFNLNTWEMTLFPEQEAEVVVEFDPLYKDDRQSHVIDRLLQVQYRGHPQRDSVALKGEVVFPNLSFDCSEIRFGCVLNESTKTIKVRASNSCKIDVRYEWVFLEQASVNANKPNKQRLTVLSTPPSHVFDILPVRALLPPSASEDVEFTMLNTTNTKLNCMVVCVVDGGPEYKFPISGESSNVSYELDKSVIDFGKVIYTSKSDQELVIANNGRVTFTYSLQPCSAEDAKYLEFLPAAGTVAANQKATVVVRLKPATPSLLKVQFQVRVAQFDPVTVDCYCQGIFPTACVSLPRQRKVGPYGETERVTSALWERFQATVINNLFCPDPALLPPVLKPAPAFGSTVAPPKFDEKLLLPPAVPGEELGLFDDSSLPQLGSQGGSLASSTKGVPAQTLEVEMQRDIMCKLLDDKILELGADRSSGIMVQDLVAAHVNLNDVVVGRYLCDFGNVIIGQTKKKMFKITNASLVGQLSWLFDKKFFSASGFSIEPEKVNKLAEGQSVDFVVKYFARTQQKVGIKAVTLPLQMPGSPTLHITFQANVCLPEINLSSYAIDFGRVILGQTARIYVGLHNPTPVAAAWSFRHVSGKDEARFHIEPSSGSLRPDKRTKIAIDFIPGEIRRCVVEFALRVDQNKKTKSLKVVGEGISLPLTTDPEALHISPVLPFSEGEERVVTVQNLSDHTVEFFSLDFDAQYKEEEAALAIITAYDERGQLRAGVREPGKPLPFEVLEAHRRALEEMPKPELPPPVATPAAAVDDKIAAASPRGDSKTTSPRGETKGTTDQSPEHTGAEPAAAESKVDLKPVPLRVKPGYRDRKQHQDIVLVGPPLSGLTTLAHYLSKKLVLAVKTLDAMLIDVAEADCELAPLARIVTGREFPRELAQRKARTAQLEVAAEQSKVEVAEEFAKDKKNKGKEVPPELLATVAVKELEAFREQNSVDVRKVARILEFRAKWMDMGDGVVIDSLNSKFLAPALALKVLERALPGIIVAAVQVGREWDGYMEWIDHLLQHKVQEEDRVRRALEINKKQLFKITKAVKGKTLEETLREMEAQFAVAVPEALPVGEESWVDISTGQVAELESNDFKLLDDKEKNLYLRQLLYHFSQQLDGLAISLKRIRGNKRLHDKLRGVEHVSDSQPEAEAPLPEEEVDPNQMNFSFFLSTVVPALTHVRKLVKPELVATEPEATVPGEEAVERAATEEAAVASEAKDETNAADESAQPASATVVGERAPSRPASARPEASRPVSASAVPEGGLVEVLLDGDESLEAVQQLVMAHLPPPKVSATEKENALPDMDVFQLYRRPANRPNRRAIKLFRIVDLNDIIAPKKAEPAPVVAPVEAEPAGKGKKGGKDAKPTKGAVEEPPPVQEVAAPTPPPPAPTRWVVPAQGSVQFKVRFASEKEGKFESTLEFEVVGTGQRVSLPCVGVCAYPSINTDTRNMFMRRLKALNPAAPHPIKRFVIAENMYSFGALSLFKKPDWKKVLTDASSAEDKEKHLLIESTHSDIIRISNNGLYRREVSLQVEYAEGDPRDVFFVEPAVLEVDEGETKEVRAWAMPKEEREYKGTLAIAVKDNPAVTRFPLQCAGTVANINIEGPWTDGLLKAEEALAKNTDKKLVKDLEAKLATLKEAFTVDFDRVLLNKTETRIFKLANTSLVPVAWEILPESFADSPYISFEPAAGEVSYNSTVEVTVSFKSSDARLLSGGFSLKFADHEGGLQTARAVTKKFKVVAEAYSINAVTFKTDGQEATGSSEIDFGLVRVGDYATQTMKMGNKGKYRIGYAFVLTKPSIEELVSIAPMEGTIEPGKDVAEIKVTFCAKKDEVLLKANAEITVHIKEPLTGEIVESFPLLVSAQSKFNTFRLQPSKGISFGAVRFDSEPRVKRAELRNESRFEITYVVCPAIAEHDEIDDLDAAAFAAYACATPAALRTGELGENYLQRAGGGADVAAGKGKKDAKPPAKGKGKGEPEPAPSTLNPLVQDPDGLVLGALPTDPLVVGAFTIHPRIATVLPGQSVSIDVKFDPSGCETVREKLRICVSGANPVDPLTVILKAFELAGESCQPAIVADNMTSIFEEQEIVSSLAESTGEKSSEGGGKLEKLPVGKVVYAEAEKMLAFGPVSCGQSGRGVVERIRISNPTKIDSKVKFKVVSPEEAAALSAALAAAAQSGGAAAAGKGGKDAKGGKDKGPAAKGGKGAPEPPPTAPSAFTVQPESWEIPPHEHRYVNVYFNPLEIKSYRSVFIAEIDDDGITTNVAPKGNSTGKRLTFGLGGSGTLPCISVDQPSAKDAEGRVVLNFNKTLVERSSKESIVIRNDGVMTATCLFDLSGDRGFVFPASGTSMQIAPGQRQIVPVTFAPQEVAGSGDCEALIKITVLNNPFDVYRVRLTGVAYSCDAVVDTSAGAETEESFLDDEPGERRDKDKASDLITFSDINLTRGPKAVSSTVLLRSRTNAPLKFDFSLAEGVPKCLTCSPSSGHLAPFESREVTVTFATDMPLVLENAKLLCALRKIEYKTNSTDARVRSSEEALWGKWDDAMKTVRRAQPQDLKAIQDYAAAIKDYESKAEAEKAKGKKGKPVGPPPEKCLLQVAPSDDQGNAMVYEVVPEPYHVLVEGYTQQQLEIPCQGVADGVAFECSAQNQTLDFAPTFMFQSTGYRFTVTNKSKMDLPILWSFKDMRRKQTSRPVSGRPGTVSTAALAGGPCPFKIEPEEAQLTANETKEFLVKFNPIDADDFVFSLTGQLFGRSSPALTSGLSEEGQQDIKAVFRGVGRRPVCHFELAETRDYLSRRLPSLKNENGLVSSIETPDLKIVELESIGLKTRNTFRFHATNTTSESYEFLWEPMGEASPFWRCVQSAGMMFPGKRVEMIFDYVPEDTHVAEAFFKFSIHRLGLQQIFLFTGKVAEPKVAFSSAKLDFHAVLLGGEGMTETVYLENHEHLPFHYSFDKYSLMQFDGPAGPVLKIDPQEGVVPPGGRSALTFFFKPQEEVVYNYNIICNVKRKPNKLSINVKGEGYAVHPQIQIENTQEGEGKDKFITLKPLPAINTADFGSVQVLDSLAKAISVLNAGKFNFDYSWNIDSIGSMLALSGGKLNGTLLKGEELNYKLTFAPQREGGLEGSALKFTVAGKYVYQIIPQGLAVKPALRFSFMRHDFGMCFITSPGGSTVIEEAVLVLKNHDPSSNISVECVLQKTRALWVECAPTVIAPGAEIQIPIRFAPREVKDYSFAVPFLVNGTGKVQVQVSGKGIAARLELVNGSQRRTAMGLVNVGASSSRSVVVVNKSQRALALQLLESGEYSTALSDRFVSFSPAQEVVLAPKETLAVKVDFKPTRRVPQFNEDLLISYAGIKRSLVTLSGKAQGFEVQLDTDSIPFGLVVLDSQKIKKLTLENTGDLTITFQWQEKTFGKHFLITPLSGKVLPGSEAVFDVIFRPKFADEDIRQDRMVLNIPGMEALHLTCSGACIAPPTDNIQLLKFSSSARKEEVKTIKVSNPTDKDWYLSPSLQGQDWRVPHEFKVAAKASGDMPVTYFPLTMAPEEKGHTGKLFIALPDGSAQMYELKGVAGAPQCAGKIEVETPAKKAATVTLKVQNWLGEKQKLNVTVEITNKPCPATFVIAANATEVGPNGTKEFPVRFVSFMEGTSRALVTFTNPETQEYTFFELHAKTTMAEVLDTYTVEAPVRQTARAIITVENPLFHENVSVNMGSLAKPAEWWTCDSKYMRVNELTPINGNREGTFEVEFRPLVVTQNNSGNLTEHLVTIITQELGTFKYKVCARATAPLLKQILRFSAPLGAMQSETFLFRAFNTVKTDYQCAVQKADVFSVQKACTVEPVAQSWEGDEIRLNIQYEPTEIGDIDDTLTVSSPDYGTYQCQLMGSCTAPMPQGPVFMDQGAAPAEIAFRNCFTTQCAWALSVDCSAFRVVQPATLTNMMVNAKTESKISIAFDPNEEQIAAALAGDSVITGKLFITCSSKPDVPSWVYYLRGKVLFDKPTNAAASKGAKKK